MTRPEYVPAQASHEWQRPIWPDVHRYDSQGLAIEALTVAFRHSGPWQKARSTYTEKWLGSYPVHLEIRRLILKARVDDEVRSFSVAIQMDHPL